MYFATRVADVLFGTKCESFLEACISYAYVGYLNNPVTRGRAAGAIAILLAPYSSGFNVFTVHQK